MTNIVENKDGAKNSDDNILKIYRDACKLIDGYTAFEVMEAFSKVFALMAVDASANQGISHKKFLRDMFDSISEMVDYITNNPQGEMIH